MSLKKSLVQLFAAALFGILTVTITEAVSVDKDLSMTLKEKQTLDEVSPFHISVL